MLYLNEPDLTRIGTDWEETSLVIRRAVECLGASDFAQPIKPYLRYRDLKNRIIAMPAFLGGPFNVAGIKWIASFPGNLDKGLPRAHSVIILNDADTGAPTAIINTALASIIRTASVSAFVLRAFDEVRPLHDFELGITGFGPIGQHHLAMVAALFGPRLRKARIYDVRPSQPPKGLLEPGRIEVVQSWQEAYDGADVFITCTVSPAPYIDRRPKPGSLQLNVSLRDYTPEIFDDVKGAILVDDWDEVCRESTDIEVFHKQRGLQKGDVKTIVDVVHGAMASYPVDQPVLFNPMGMGVFDLAIATHFYEKARKLGVGTRLDEPLQERIGP